MTLTVAPISAESKRLPEAVHQYFLAWNAHDAEAVVAALGSGGTYTDPATITPIQGHALRAYLDGFFAAFGDATFEIVSVASGEKYVTIEWLMRATNTGPLQANLPPTGAAVTLPGTDVFTLGGERISSVRVYFDQQTLFTQLGLQVSVQPVALGPVSFGRALRLSTGSRVKPAAFSTTWVDVSTDAERDEVITRTREMFADLVHMPGFIGATFMDIAGRLSTQTAWESEEAARAILELPKHKAALARVFGGELGAALHTSVWAPSRQNPLWVRCSVCGRIEEYADSGQSLCGEPFPDQPPYW